jgi:hypothetical protein
MPEGVHHQDEHYHRDQGSAMNNNDKLVKFHFLKKKINFIKINILRKDDIEKKFGKEEKIAFEMRLNEQLNRNFASIEDGAIELTQTGRGVLKIAVTVNSIYQLQGWRKHLIWKNCS